MALKYDPEKHGLLKFLYGDDIGAYADDAMLGAAAPFVGFARAGPSALSKSSRTAAKTLRGQDDLMRGIRTLDWLGKEMKHKKLTPGAMMRRAAKDATRSEKKVAYTALRNRPKLNRLSKMVDRAESSVESLRGMQDRLDHGVGSSDKVLSYYDKSSKFKVGILVAEAEKKKLVEEISVLTKAIGRERIPEKAKNLATKMYKSKKAKQPRAFRFQFADQAIDRTPYGREKSDLGSRVRHRLGFAGNE